MGLAGTTIFRKEGVTMQLCKVQTETGQTRVGMVEAGHVRLLLNLQSLSDILHADNPAGAARDLIDDSTPRLPVGEVTFLAPIDRQEVWAAGVTYKRSQEARERESAGAGSFYDKVYSAERPELFLKATPHRVVGPGEFVRIRRDSRWNVPEPELTLVISPRLKLVGYTCGNDMSSRDIEGENPLYLPQAKVYDHSCALGPVITLAEAMPPLEQVVIRLLIERRGQTVFDGSTSVAQMKRTPQELMQWLGRDNSFPAGVFLLTGTGIVPPDDFTLSGEDRVSIDISGVGRLTNYVEG
jgi:2-dehydro-3-deoxy-D-arabinonate dehydratase